MATFYNANNVKVGLAYGLIAPGGTAMCADAWPLGTVWGPLWTPGGATDEGWKLGGDSNTQEVNIEEQQLPVDSNVESRSVTIEAALAEDTLQSWLWGFGGGTIVTNAQTGIRELKLTTELIPYAVGLEMDVPGNYVRRMYIPRTKASGSVSVDFRRVADKRMIPVSFSAICAIEDIVIKEYPRVPPT